MIIKMLTGNSTVTSRNGDKLFLITHRAGNEQVNVGVILLANNTALSHQYLHISFCAAIVCFFLKTRRNVGGLP